MRTFLERHPVLAYTAARLLLFVGALAILSLVGLRSIALVVAALLVSGLLSYWLLSRPRQEMSVAVASRLTRIRSGLDDGAASEDDEYAEPLDSPKGTVMAALLSSRADVVSETPERYAKQRVSHLSHKLTAEEIGPGTRLVFDGGSCTVTPYDGKLVLEALASDVEVLERIESVVGGHLERFGQRNELVVTWERDGAEP